MPVFLSPRGLGPSCRGRCLTWQLHRVRICMAAEGTPWVFLSRKWSWRVMRATSLSEGSSNYYRVCSSQKSRHTESEKLQVQIQAYLDNVFDVGGLLEDAETKNVALEKVEELEEHVSHVSSPLLLPELPLRVGRGRGCLSSILRSREASEPDTLWPRPG